MAKQIQRLVDVGLGRETVRGSAEAAPDFWLPKIDFDFVPKVGVAVDNSGIGVIDARQDGAVVSKYGEGAVGGIVYDKSFGILLALALGTWSSSTAVDSAYTHTFTRLNSNSHPAVSLFVKDENLDEVYALGMLNQLTVNAVVDDYVKFTAGFMSKNGESTTQTPSYSAENAFAPKHLAFKMASTVAALGTASETNLRSMRLTINKNTELWNELGSQEPADIVNKEFAVEGEIELVFDGETERDYVLDGTKMAMSVALTNDDVTIGTATNPSLSFSLAPVTFEEFSRSGGPGEVEVQTLRFAGNFSISDSKTISAILVNEQASY
jgi:hypothetical protein